MFCRKLQILFHEGILFYHLSVKEVTWNLHGDDRRKIFYFYTESCFSLHFLWGSFLSWISLIFVKNTQFNIFHENHEMVISVHSYLLRSQCSRCTIHFYSQSSFLCSWLWHNNCFPIFHLNFKHIKAFPFILHESNKARWSWGFPKETALSWHPLCWNCKWHAISPNK